MLSCTGSNLVSRHTVQYQLWHLMHCSYDDAWPPWSAHPLLKATTEFKAIYIHTQPIKKNHLYKYVVYWNGIQIVHG